MPLINGKPLILYIFTTNSSLGILLAQEDNNNKEWAIYYLSRILISYELNYNIIEKYCLGIVFASQKLRHYILIHTTRLIAKIDPFKYLPNKATLIGRVAKWVLILSEFDIENKKLLKEKQSLIN